MQFEHAKHIFQRLDRRFQNYIKFVTNWRFCHSSDTIFGVHVHLRFFARTLADKRIFLNQQFPIWRKQWRRRIWVFYFNFICHMTPCDNCDFFLLRTPRIGVIMWNANFSNMYKLTTRSTIVTFCTNEIWKKHSSRQGTLRSVVLIEKNSTIVHDMSRWVSQTILTRLCHVNYLKNTNRKRLTGKWQFLTTPTAKKLEPKWLR